MRRTELQSEAQLRAALAASLAESKANPDPGYCAWDFYPVGYMRYRNWRAGEGRRRSDRRWIRRKIRLLKGGAK